MEKWIYFSFVSIIHSGQDIVSRSKPKNNPTYVRFTLKNPQMETELWTQDRLGEFLN
jgi:hypothetical protein